MSQANLDTVYPRLEASSFNRGRADGEGLPTVEVLRW